MNAVAQSLNGGEVLERVIIGGDLAKMQPQERVMYYDSVCRSLGLNPLTRPFDYVTLQGKMTLYARKDATEQLRKIHGVSIRITARELVDDVYIVTAQAQDKSGRCDEATGAVSVAGLKGENKANAVMKAETKAKRRVTLSICGLGMLDESEASSVPGAQFPAVPEHAQQPAPALAAPEAPVDRELSDAGTEAARKGTAVYQDWYGALSKEARKAIPRTLHEAWWQAAQDADDAAGMA